ncbi:unnamed protein product, partial [Darwinula stevensoni]
MKEQFRETDIARKISHVCFGVHSPEEIQQAAHILVFATNLYGQDNSRTPVLNGVLDRRMGTSQGDGNCATCGLGLADCVGHFGYIDLELPVFHVGYFRSIITILQSICKNCSRILLPPTEKQMFHAKVTNPHMKYLMKKTMRKKILDKCKKISECPYCREMNGMVKKAGLLKISHDKFRSAKKHSTLIKDYVGEFQ